MIRNYPKIIVLCVGGLIAASGGLVGGYGIKAVSVHHQISEYLASHTVRKMQIGAGDAFSFKEFADWLNTDIDPKGSETYLDAAKPFPIPDNSLSVIFSEHLIEHLPYRDGSAMLRESYRTLKPGGKIRIATPNLLRLIQLFEDAKTDEMKAYIHDKIEADYWETPLPRTASPECVILNAELNNPGSGSYHIGHQFVYDPKTLRESLERAGFRDIKQFAPGESDDPQLRGLELRHKSIHRTMNDYETMVFQAEK